MDRQLKSCRRRPRLAFLPALFLSRARHLAGRRPPCRPGNWCRRRTTGTTRLSPGNGDRGRARTGHSPIAAVWRTGPGVARAGSGTGGDRPAFPVMVELRPALHVPVCRAAAIPDLTSTPHAASHRADHCPCCKCGTERSLRVRGRSISGDGACRHRAGDNHRLYPALCRPRRLYRDDPTLS